MHIKCLAAIVAAVAAFTLAATDQAAADGVKAEASAAKKVVHRVRYARGPQFVRGPWPGGPDPYAYSYNRPSYYPYYNSKYWVPRKQMLARTKYPMRIPEYGSSWGYPLACKLQGRRHCGVPFRPRAGHAAHSYNRAEQLRLTGSPHHNY